MENGDSADNGAALLPLSTSTKKREKKTEIIIVGGRGEGEKKEGRKESLAFSVGTYRRCWASTECDLPMVRSLPSRRMLRATGEGLLPPPGSAADPAGRAGQESIAKGPGSLE